MKTAAQRHRRGIIVEDASQKFSNSSGAAYSDLGGALDLLATGCYKDSAPDGVSVRGVHAAHFPICFPDFAWRKTSLVLERLRLSDAPHRAVLPSTAIDDQPGVPGCYENQASNHAKMVEPTPTCHRMPDGELREAFEAPQPDFDSSTSSRDLKLKFSKLKQWILLRAPGSAAANNTNLISHENQTQ